MVTVEGSLFGPSHTAVLPEAANWITSTLFSGLATSLCVIAIALVGFMMIMGRFAIRDGARVVLGCFVLLGAPAIASALQAMASAAAVARTPAEPSIAPPAPSSTLTPSTYDPYAGASLRIE